MVDATTLASVVNGATIKDAVAYRIHRKSGGEYGVSANPLASLAEIFNDYNQFQPQNLMLEYITSSNGSIPVKKFPYSASAPKLSYLTTHTQEIEPTNFTIKTSYEALIG
jgi:hypothetical protein